MYRDITLFRQQADLLSARHSELKELYPQPPPLDASLDCPLGDMHSPAVNGQADYGFLGL